MRPSPLHLCIRALLAAALLASAAGAAELGDIVPRSYIGQPLAADIELLALTPEEVAGLQVRLAAPDVYRGANVTMHPALGSVRMAVVTRDQKQFLHVTTTRAIDADYVHLYVALGTAGRQEVRLATVWLQPDPTPAPVVAAVPSASVMTPAQAERIAAQARAEREAAAKAAVAATAPAAAPVRDRTRPAPLPSVHESEVGTPGAIRAAAAPEPAPEPVRREAPASVRDLPQRIAGVLVTPRGSPVKPSAGKEAPAGEAAVPLGVAQALLPLPPLPLPKGVKRPPAAAASCAPTGISAKECVALDNHNAALSSKLVELEGKLKALQGAVGGGTATAAAPGVASHAEKPASAAAHAAAAPAPATASASASAAAHAASAKDGSASASASATMAPEAHAAKASAGEGGASATAASASSAASVPAKQVRVLPKLKYKKEKPVEKPADYTLPLAAGGVGLLALLGAGFIYLRKRKAGGGPLKIWQGFRKKKAPEDAQPLEEVTPESLMQ